MLKKTFGIFLKILFTVLLLLLIVFFVFYAVAPVYRFADQKPFVGAELLNPYQHLDSTQWKKGNFQAQSHAWFGFTSGRHNFNKAIQTIYKQLGYDIIVTSDYMRINEFGKGKPGYIPTYEHGYGISKNHQVCLGSKKVCWRDYPFFQTLSHKQHIINILKKQNKVVALAHPDLRDAYTPDDLRYLTNYDLIEAFSNVRYSYPHWDAALTSGHLVYLLADDDTHDIFDPTQVGRIFTMVNTSVLEEDAILDALKSGKAYAVRIGMRPGADFVEKTKDHQHLPSLEYFHVSGDTVFVKVSRKAREIEFIGRQGLTWGMVRDTCFARYTFNPTDTYIRTVIRFPDSTEFYFNPVVRYDGKNLPEAISPEINLTATWIQRAIALAIVVIVLLIVVRVKRNRRRRRRSPGRYYFHR
jgi:hypothetical protein